MSDVAIGTGSLVRGLSTTAAMLVPRMGVPGRVLRTGLVAGGYLVSLRLEQERPEMRLAQPAPADGETARTTTGTAVGAVTGTIGWVALQAVLGHAAARLPLPRIVTALATGALVAVADQRLANIAGGAVDDMLNALRAPST